MSILNDDLDAMLADETFRVTVSHGGFTTFGYELDSDSIPDGDDPYGDNDTLGRTHVILIRTHSLPSIAQGEQVTLESEINGVDAAATWHVRRVMHEDDGRLQRLVLGKKVA